MTRRPFDGDPARIADVTASISDRTWLALLVAGIGSAVTIASGRGEPADVWIPRADVGATEPDASERPGTIAGAPKPLESDLETPTSWVTLGEKRARRDVRSEDSPSARDASPTSLMNVLLGRLDDANAAFEREDLAAARELANSIDDDDVGVYLPAAVLVEAAREPTDEGDRASRRALWTVGVENVREVLRTLRFEAMHAALDSTRFEGIGTSEVNLASLVASLRRRTRLAVHVLPDTWKQGGARLRFDPSEFEGASGTRVLDLLISRTGDLGWELRDDDVTIGPAAQVGNMGVRCFALRPPLPMEPVRLLDASFLPPELADSPPREDGGARAVLARLRARVTPDSWTAEQASLEIKSGVLIARNHDRVLERLGAYLDEIGAGTLPVSAYFNDGSDGDFRGGRTDSK